MLKKYYWFIFILLMGFNFYSLANNLFAQSQFLEVFKNSKKSIGLFNDLNFNNHFVDFAKLKDYPLCCTDFNYGFGFGMNFGLLADINMFKYPFDLQFRFGYSYLSADFQESEPKVLGLNGKPVNGYIDYTIKTSISLIDFSTYAKKEIYKNLNLLTGLKFGKTTKKNFEQQEKISVGIFADSKSNIRNKKNGIIPEFSSFITFLSLGLNYEYYLLTDSNWILKPEIFCDFALHNLQYDSSWYIISPKIGFSLSYNIPPPEQEILEYEFKEYIDTVEIKKTILSKNHIILGVPLIQTDTIINSDKNLRNIIRIVRRTDTLYTLQEFKLQASVKAVGVDDGIENKIVTMEIKEYQYFNMRPLLNYIFFDENSSKIPDRYSLLNKNEALEFDLELINDLKTLETYYHVLNIVGYRLKQYPKATISIIGCNSNINSEANNLTLSTDRASNLMEYFINIWGISVDRIKLKSRNLPDKPSPEELSDGIEENRRVEIISDNIEIMSPLLIDDTLKTTTPSDITFYPNIIAEAGLKNWSIQAYQNNIIFKEFFGNEKYPKYLDWSIDLEKSTIPTFNLPLLFHIEAMDSLNQNIISTIDSIPLLLKKIEKTKNQVGDKKVEHFSLILFDFDDTSLNESNQRIKDYIKTKISPTSKVIIAGYTDRLGDEEYNQKLSQNRAISLAKILNLSLDSTQGIGESVLLYDNKLPEGRFYCRTVEVIIETPILKNQED